MLDYLRRLVFPGMHNQLTGLIATAFLCSFISGCGLFGKDKLKPAISGYVPPAAQKFSGQADGSDVRLRLFAGQNVNADDNGRPLALLVKLYLLRDATAFEQIDYDTFLQDDAVENALGSDLLDARETLFIPGQSYRTFAPQMRSGGYLGVVALFRNPAPQRWRAVFELDPPDPKNKGAAGDIVAGFGQCAIVVTKGAMVDTHGVSFDRLGNVRCPRMAKP